MTRPRTEEETEARRVKSQEYSRRYAATHPEEVKESKRRWYASHLEEARAARRVYAAAHREQHNATARLWKTANPDKVAATRRKSRGHPEPTRPLPMRCEVCGEDNGHRTMHLDHDHMTGAFRGWLCFKCNSSLGNANDSPSLLRALADYLERTK